jgi:hypothetical protein
MVSIAWKTLSSEDKEDWEEMARRDKARYEMEKTMYTGPWKVPAKKRSQKDPNAPKRPMSAFLSFSNSKRAQVKIKHSDIGNAEVSRILAQMWKDAGEEERKEHIDKEFKLRQTYKVAIAEWRTNSENEMQAARTEREDRAMQAVLAGKSAQDADYYPNDQAAAGPYYGAPDYQTHPPPPPGTHSEAVPPSIASNMENTPAGYYAHYQYYGHGDYADPSAPPTSMDPGGGPYPQGPYYYDRVTPRYDGYGQPYVHGGMVYPNPYGECHRCQESRHFDRARQKDSSDSPVTLLSMNEECPPHTAVDQHYSSGAHYPRDAYGQPYYGTHGDGSGSEGAPPPSIGAYSYTGYQS